MMEKSEKVINELIEALNDGIGKLSPKGSLVERIGEERYLAILRKTVHSLPDRPSDAGMTAAQIKEAFYRPITDEKGSIYAEINRIADELNLGGAQIEEVLTLMSELVAAIYNNSVDKTSFDDKMKEVAESLGKCVKRADGEGENIYASAGGKDQLVPISSEALPDTAVKRDNAGHVKVTAPAAEDDAISLGYARRTFAKKGDVPTSVANALIGSEMGEVVALKDVSPLEHNLKVSISGVDNPEAVKLLVQGKNLFDVSKIQTSATIINNNDGTVLVKGNAQSTGRRFRELCPNLKVGDIFTISLRVTNAVQDTKEVGYIYIGDSYAKTLTSRKSYTVTEDMLNGTTYLYKADYANADKVTEGVVSEIQVEIGTESEYEPYKEPIEYAQGEEIKSISPSTTLMTDTEGAVISVEYNRDINKAFEELMKIILSLGGNLYV